ncbi:MAG TPA: HlyD family secretion protein [Gemmataceae bacterium]|jgi:multidrug resistance efflux pump|nr:HlyD family secretion protein [Gemmataceae bacterium]
MIDTHRLRLFLGWLGRIMLAVLLSPLTIGRKLLRSARAWVLFVLLGIAALVAYYVLSDRHTPFTTDAYVQAYVIQVAPRIEGQVVYVHVRENQPVKKGELLFEIDRRPFQHRVDLLIAKRVEAVQQVAQLDADLSAARAEDARLVAEEAYAREVHGQEKAIYKQEATTDRKYLDAIQKYKAAQAALERSRAQVRKVEQALAARVGAEHALVAEVEAQLAEARLNLDWTRIYAPANGYVTNVQLREGSYVHVGIPVLTCIDGDQWWVVANFRENSLENVRPGQRVGLTFNTYPGRIFPGVVESVGWGVNQGQGAPSGSLPAIPEPQNWIRLAQRFQVRIIPQLPPGSPLRVGATASVAVYTREEYWLNGVTETLQKIEAALEHLR